MACITTIAPMAMATTQLARVVRYEETLVSQETRVERTPLRMSWVVATDGNGKRTLRICWAVDC
jgi:hypothetical protein